MHEELSISLGIDLKSVKPLPATKLYVDFLNSSASLNSIASICASMVPCMALYAFIGRRAVENGLCVDVESNRWVKEYSSADFQRYSSHLEQLLDRYALQEKKSDRDLEGFYSKAMELEYAFFNAMEFPSLSGVKPNSILVDFDETISLEDTIALICQANQDVDPGKPAAYQAMLREYLAKYEDFMTTNMPKERDDLKFDRNAVDNFLLKLTEFETNMLAPVEASGILKGITGKQLRKIGAGIALRQGVFEVLRFGQRLLPEAANSIQIVTLNWSRDVVEGACSDPLLSRVAVHSNDLIWERGTPSLLSNGSIDRVMTGPSHKGDLVRKLWNTLPSSSAQNPNVFIGDGLGDLSALLDADIGILVGGKKSIQSYCRAFGIRLLPLDTLLFHPLSTPSNLSTYTSPTLYLAESWVHIGICLFGKAFTSSWMASYDHSKDGHMAEERRLPTVLTVAGSDSGGGAGIQADLKTYGAHGVFGASVITALTAQNTVGVSGVEVVSDAFVTSQLNAVLTDLRVDVIKSGMMPTEGGAVALAAALIHYKIGAFVMDPVMVASSGDRLMPAAEANAIRRTLFPLATLITPNIHEACALLDIPFISTVQEMEAAAKQLFAFGSAYVLVKGGHLVEGQTVGQVVDVLYDGTTFEHISGACIASSNTHGTGCTLASSIASHIAKGLSVPSAVRAAKTYLTSILSLSKDLKIGAGPHGPLHHMAGLLPTISASGYQRKNAIDLSVYAITDGDMNAKYHRSIEDSVAAGLLATVLNICTLSASIIFKCT